MNGVVKHQGGVVRAANDLASQREASHHLRLLSPAQRRVLALIGAGKMTKEIAAEMHIGENGVLWHRKEIYRKLAINSVAEAVRMAWQCRLLTTDY